MKVEDFTAESPGQTVVIRDDGLLAFISDDLTEEVTLSPDVVQKHDQALIALGALGAVIPRLPAPGLVTSPFLAREAVLSSRIEGTRTEVDQLYLFEVDESAVEADETTPKGGIDDAAEVRNYIRALHFGLEQLKTRPVHARLLREMHEILMQGARGEDKAPGHYRWKQVYVGAGSIEQARYVAPPAEKVDALMNALELHINFEGSRLPSLVRIARIHYQFEAIHPFNDGNGRLGRLLISMLLTSYGLLPEPLLYLSAYFERHKSDYADHLWQITRRGAWEDWHQFFLDGVIQEARDAIDRAQKLLELREEFRAKLQHGRASAKALHLADHLFKTPAVTVNGASKLLSMSFGGANKCVKSLMKVGLLEQATSRQRNRIFISRPILDLLR